jgi:hypothetical protein
MSASRTRRESAAARAQTVPATTTTVDTRACQPPFDLAHGFIFCDTARSLDELALLAPRALLREDDPELPFWVEPDDLDEDEP